MSNSESKIRLAISTCPNDTFAFHGILERKVDMLGLDFEIELLDIQQLNDGLFENKFDVAKASFHAAATLSEATVVLPSGSALGFGVGPLLLAAEPGTSPCPTSDSLVLCPGKHTTASMLFHLFYGAVNVPDGRPSSKVKVEHVVFSDIMPRLQESKADFGVCIHEGRFTWEEAGLFLVEDLGARWELETDWPLPLGGILARRGMGDGMLSRIQNVIQSSVKYGLANREETLTTMKKYAQEFDEAVLFGHVDLYVNEWTVDLGEAGQGALSMLSQKARESGLISPASRDIEVWRPT